MSGRLGVVLRLVCAGAALAAFGAHAGGGDYEARLVQRTLGELERTVAPEPSGKRIRDVIIRPHDIIGPDDPYPTVLNVAHVTTRPSVIERELLFGEGDVYDPAVIEETERNLRDMFILAVARIVPLATSDPGWVDVLVVTRDLWSIRFNSSFNLVGSLLQYLRVRPTEQNLFGLDKRLSLDFELQLDTFAVGQVYVDRRLAGTRLALVEQANVIFNRATGAIEGSEGLVQLTRPLYSLSTEWGFELGIAWNVRRDRLFRGPAVWELPFPGGGTVPHIFDTRELDVSAFYTRAHLGPGFKLDLSPGIGAFSHVYLPPEGIDGAGLAVLRERVLPKSERALYVALRVRAFAPEYRVLRDVMTFALTEDYQVGPLLRAEVRLARSPAQTFSEAWMSARYRIVAADSLTQVQAGGSVRFIAGAPTAFVNRRAAVDALHVTPFVGPGRFGVRAVAEVVADDLDRRTLLLGGGNGLRGAKPESLAGTRLVLFNAEYRTRPVELRTLHVGGAVFWDAGTVWAEGPVPALTHTVGVGLRALFPQFDVEPLRIDFGYVLPGGGPRPVDRFSSSFGQVTRYRPKLLDQPFE